MIFSFQGRIIAAPFFHVGFADFWLADQLNSLASAFLDFHFVICFYLSNGNWIEPDGDCSLIEIHSVNEISIKRKFYAFQIPRSAWIIRTLSVHLYIAYQRGSGLLSASGDMWTPGKHFRIWLMQLNILRRSSLSYSLPSAASIKVRHAYHFLKICYQGLIATIKACLFTYLTSGGIIESVTNNINFCWLKL